MPHAKKVYTVFKLAEGTALEFYRAPLSGRPTFAFGPLKRATRFTRHEAQAAACLLVRIEGSASNLSIEEG